MSGRATKMRKVSDMSVNEQSTQEASAAGAAHARTTVVFPAPLNANWEVFALSTGQIKERHFNRSTGRTP